MPCVATTLRSTASIEPGEERVGFAFMLQNTRFPACSGNSAKESSATSLNPESPVEERELDGNEDASPANKLSGWECKGISALRV